MMKRIWTQHLGWATLCFGTIATAIYAVMITVTLPQIEAASGQIPFDMRPLGYTLQDARDILNGLGAAGRDSYLYAQIPLDTLYPALLALTLISAMHWFGRNERTNRLVRIGTILAITAAVCDYSENIGIVAMILSWPNLSDPLVHASSVATIAKSIATTLAVLTTLVIICQWALPRRSVHT